MNPIPESFPVLHTDRLQLNAITHRDLDEIFALRSDAHNRRFIDGPLAKDREEALAFIERIEKGINEREILYWAIRESEKAGLIGSVCLWNFSSDYTTAELGYELTPASQGKGYMTELLTTLIDFSFGRLALKKLKAFTHHQNLKSRQLLERCQFQWIETIRESQSTDGEAIEMVVYSLER